MKWKEIMGTILFCEGWLEKKCCFSQENKFKVMSLKFYHIWLENNVLNFLGQDM